MTTTHTETACNLLALAKAVIQDPRDWCRGSGALDRAGRAVPINAASACRFCAVGALGLTTGAESTAAYPMAVSALYNAAKKMGFNSPPLLNDQTNHPKVMEMYDLAVEILETR